MDETLRRSAAPLANRWGHAPPAAPARNDGRGFTLFELLVVLAIAALLLAVVPFSLLRLQASVDYRSTIRSIAAGLSAARTQALATGRDVAFRVDLEGRQFGVDGGDTRRLPEALQIRVTVADREVVDRVARIRFYPMGGSTGGSIEILRAADEGTRLRTDWLDGRVSFEPLLQ